MLSVALCSDWWWIFWALNHVWHKHWLLQGETSIHVMLIVDHWYSPMLFPTQNKNTASEIKKNKTVPLWGFIGITRTARPYTCVAVLVLAISQPTTLELNALCRRMTIVTCFSEGQVRPALGSDNMQGLNGVICNACCLRQLSQNKQV